MYYSSSYLQKGSNKAEDVWIGALRYKDENGKWKAIRKTFHVKYKREAKKLLSEWQEEMESKKSRDVDFKTVEQAITEYLENQRSLNQISIVTYQGNMERARYGIFPYIGKKSFYDLSAKELQDYINELSRKYKPNSVRTIFAILYKVILRAYHKGEFKTNLLRLIELPEEKGHKINYLDADGRRKFLSSMKEDSGFYIPSMIAYYTGMRAGEVCALRWDDINYATNTIHVRHSAKVFKDEDGKKVVEVSDTKSYKHRTVPLLPQLKRILEAQEERAEPDSRDFVVGQRDPRLLCTSFLKWSQRNKVMGTLDKPITMHGLRHTFATLGVQSKMDIKSLSSILGHASASMTLDIYASDDERAKQANMAILGTMLAEEEESEF